MNDATEMTFIELAAKLNKQYHEILRRKQCHFRGGLGGISLVSLSNKTPELGFSRVDERHVLDMIDAIDNLEPPKRKTPEKKLQAWLINQLLFGVAPAFWTQYNLIFITSELRIKTDNATDVNDILAIDSNGALWVIELKSARKLDELIIQCKKFTRAIEAHKEMFKDIIKLSEKGITWDGKTINKMIIWPVSAGRARSETLQKIKDNNIIAVTYTKEYDFAFES